MLYFRDQGNSKAFNACIFAIIFVMLSSCGGGGGSSSGTPAPATITSIAITPVAASVAIGQIANLTATATYSDSTTADVTTQANWTIANPAIATIGASTGIVTGVALGNTTVTASINGSIVSPAVPVSVTATGISGTITISPASATVASGLPVTFTAIDNTGANVSGSVAWLSSNNTVATVNASGIATTRAQGLTYITASANGGTSNVATLTVSPPILTALSITPAPASVPMGLPTQLTATGIFTDGLQIDITSQVSWTSANPAVATVDANGLVTGLVLGSSTTVTASFMGLITSAPATVTVAAAVLTGVSITPAVPSTPMLVPLTLTATGTYSDGSTGNISGSVTWLSSNPAVATVNASGIATPVSEGTTSITAVTGNIISNVAVLTVNPALVFPSGPAIVTAVSAPGQVTLTWSPEVNAASYNLYWGSAPGITNASTQVLNVTSPYVQTGLTDGLTYYFRVSTVNAFPGEALAPEVASFLYVGGNPAGNFTQKAALPGGPATLLPGGNTVLVENQLYDIATGTASLTTGSMSAGARLYETATLLPNGLVLIAGGATNTPAAFASSSAELFDPATGTFANSTSSMSAIRQYHSATLLPNGTVLIAGGMDASGTALFSADIYDPATDTFTPTGSLTLARRSHTATLLPNGKVLITGGRDWSTTYLYSAELYDPKTGKFTTVVNAMKRNRAEHTATLLPSGKVLLTGGYGGTPSAIAYNNSAELFDPANNSFTLLVNTMSTGRWGHSAALLPNGKVLLSGGYFGTTGSLGLQSAEIFDPAAGSFTLTTNTMAVKRDINTATLLPTGDVLINGGALLAELFN